MDQQFSVSLPDEMAAQVRGKGRGQLVSVA
jgi:hypothetical protein